MPIVPGRRLGPYEILSAIGGGGMGEVYRARDSKLGRDVAIKVLPEAFAHDADRLSRFQREAKMLASLNHPNIATIHGLEQSGDTSYLVMELVSGDTLAGRVKAGPLGIEEALKIAVQIAAALEAAHEKNIIHRDLKPANVKVTPEGKVKVLDFGLAKAFASDAGNDDPSNSPTLSAEATMQGTILGTAAYMSPEQARGKAVDKRTDIWAFGCVLYELLTARRAFQGETLPDTIAAVLEREPDWQAVAPSTPAKIRDLLRRCLQKDLQRRLRDLGDARIEIEEALTAPAMAGRSIQPDTDLGRAAVSGPDSSARPQIWLRSRAALWIAAGMMAVLLAVGLSYRFSGRGETIDSVAVLPFVNASADPNMEYLSDGITESLINSLSQLPHLKVMSRDSAFRYKGKETDAQTVGRALGVRAIFKGRIMQRGDSLDISAELVDARDNSHIWGEQYSRRSAGIFALQGEIAKEITTTLRMRLSGEDEKRIAKSYTANPEAYQDYLKGRFWWNKRTREGINKGIDYFQQAIEKDPSYALAYSGLADSYSLLANNGFVAAKDAYPRAKEAAQKAIEIDDALAEAHASLGYVKYQFEWDWSGAERELQRSIVLNPGSAIDHDRYGNILGRMGRVEEAVAEKRRAVELDPLSLIINRNLGTILYLARQYDQAIEQERKTLELDPNYIGVHLTIGQAYLEKSMYKEGLAEFEKELTISPGDPVSLSWLGYGYAIVGRKAEAQKVLDQLREGSKQKYVPPWAVADIYVGLGERDKAFEWLEKAYEEHFAGLRSTIKVEPIYDPLRSDPRFADLLRRMNLQQ